MAELWIRREEYQDPPAVEGRTLTLRLATYGRTYTIGRNGSRIMRERILGGAFKGPMARPSGVLRFRHIGEKDGDTDSLDNIYGTILRMWQDGDEVLSDWYVEEGDKGDKILRLAPHIRGASISAKVAESRRAGDGATEIQRFSQFYGASLTSQPAYDDAGLVAMRQANAEAILREQEANRRAMKLLASR